MVWDTSQPLSIQAARTINVGRGSGGSTAVGPDNSLFFDDFSSGDTSKTENGFTWDIGSKPVESMPTPHSNKMGLKFTYSGSNYGDATSEARYTMGGQYFETWERFSLYIPLNYYHRAVMKVELDISPDSPDWNQDDTVTTSTGATGKIEFVDTINNRLIIDNFSSSVDSSWLVEITNDQTGALATGTNRNGVGTNHKFSIQWEGNYSSNAIGVETWSYGNRPQNGGGIVTCYSTTNTENGGNSNTGHRNDDSGQDTILIDPAIDAGKLVEFTIRRRRASALGVADGIVQIWRKRITDGGVRDLVFKNTGEMTCFDPDNNFFTKGYVLGWANGGFREDTIMYITDFYFYNTKPDDIDSQEVA